jgi:2-C-methyl-D-erythritol 4-phosphate cytidylyltransferase
MGNVGVVIPAAGKGLRMGMKSPKQFLTIKGFSLLERSIAVFDSLQVIGEIVLVVPRGYQRSVLHMMRRRNFRKVSRVVIGGKERQDSVWNGLKGFKHPPETVLVHDAVRPMVTPRIVREVIREAGIHGAAVVGVPVKDTIKIEKRRGFFAGTLDRSRLWSVQTPQGFSYKVLMNAHKAARKSGFYGTDESSLVERRGVKVRIVEGEDRNIKVTTKDDLEMVKAWLELGK